MLNIDGVQIPEGFRQVNIGEIRASGDLYYNNGTKGWLPIIQLVGMMVNNIYPIIIRPVSETTNKENKPMNNTARLITTFHCGRSCSYCKHRNPIFLAKSQTTKSLLSLKYYSRILVVGGEPALEIKRTADIIKELKANNPAVQIVLYSAHYTKWLPLVLGDIYGLHYAIHENLIEKDLDSFYLLQAEILKKKHYLTHSFHLFVHPKISDGVVIRPICWNTISTKIIADSTLSKNEDLYIYNERD